MKPNLRRCVSCRTIADKSAFWRIVRVHPTHVVQIGSGMGRSAYICQQPECVKAAQRKNRLGRALKATVPEVIYETFWQQLAINKNP
jgi:hypothetical protein